MAICAVLFDLGETLWHMPDPPPIEAIREEPVRRISSLLRAWGVEPEGGLNYLGRDIRLALQEADRQAYQSDCVSPHYPTLARQVAAAKGLELTQEQGEQLWDTWNLGGAFFGRRLFDDAIEALEALRGAGYRLACVTNRSFGGPRFLEEMRDLGLTQFFEVISISCDLGYMKPHPRIFQHALDALGLEPREAVTVGDSLHADVAGAQALGMTAVWRRRPIARQETDGVRPDFVVDELGAIPALACFRPDGRAQAGPRPGASSR